MITSVHGGRGWIGGGGEGGEGRNRKLKSTSRRLHFVQRARHGETFLHFRRFGSDARVVRQLRHDLRVVQMRFAVYFSHPDPVAASDAARAPIVGNEPIGKGEKKNKKTGVPGVTQELPWIAPGKDFRRRCRVVYIVCGDVFCWLTNRWALACEKLDFGGSWKSESALTLSAVTKKQQTPR